MAMTERDKKTLAIVLVLLVLGGFWFLILGPKRSAVAEAELAKSDAQAALDQAVQAEAASSAVKTKKPASYAKLVRLGAAIPVDDDFPGLLVQVNGMANDSNVEFRDFTGGAVSGESSGPTGALGSSVCDQDAPSPATGATPPTAGAGATEPASAGATAQTTIGADKAKAEGAASTIEQRNAAAECADAPTLADLSAQAAGLTTYKYTLTFKGSFYNLDSLFGRLLGMVKTRNGKVKANGRLLNITAINMTVEKFPVLSASVQMTGYSMPLESAVPATGPGAAQPSAVPAASTTGGGP